MLLPRAAAQFARERLGLDAKAAQVAEHLEEDAEGIGGRRVPEFQHHRRIQRGDVAMENVARDAASTHLGIAARERLGLAAGRDRMMLGKVGAHHQRVDLGRVPAQDRVLIRIRKNLRLHKVAGGERFRDVAGLAHLFERGLKERLAIVVEVMARSRSIEVNTALARHARDASRVRAARNFRVRGCRYRSAARESRYQRGCARRRRSGDTRWCARRFAGARAAHTSRCHRVRARA